MHSKSCYALFLLALVACQAAPSHKIIEKSNNETEAKLAKEDLKLENTGADKDRAKKSTTFCVQVHSGKEEIVPCKQEIKETPVVNIKSPEYRPQTAPLIQYPVSNIVVQQPVPQPSSSVPVHQAPQVIPQQTVVHLPVQPQQSASFTAPQLVPQPVPQQHVHVQTQPQHFSVPEPVPQVHVQQPVVPAPAPTPIINIIPAPAAPCEKLELQPPQQIHTVHVVQPPQPAPQSPVIHHAIQPPQLAPQSVVIHHAIQPPQPAPQLPVNHPVVQPPQLAPQLPVNHPVVQPPQLAPQPPVIHEIKPLVRPIKVEQERPPQLLPVPQQEISVPVAHLPCKSDVIFAPPSPVELIYREEEPAKLVEYVPVSQESYECSCQSEQQSKVKPSKHHVTLYPTSGRMSHRSPMMAVQYNPSIMGSENTSPVVFATQTREAEGRHHHKEKLPLHLSVQYPAYSSFNPPTYESNSYLPSTYNNYPYAYSFSGTYSSYPATNYNSYSKEYSYPYSTVPLITVNTGGPFYRNLENENSQEFSTDNKSIQETVSNVEDVSFSNQKRGAISTQFTNDKQKEITEELSVENENIKQIGPKTDEILKQKEE